MPAAKDEVFRKSRRLKAADFVELFELFMG